MHVTLAGAFIDIVGAAMVVFGVSVESGWVTGCGYVIGTIGGCMTLVGLIGLGVAMGIRKERR